MSSEAVKRHILASINSLCIPLDRTPTTAKVADVCSAAKLLRNRVLREFSRVEKSIETLRQREFYGDSDDTSETEVNPHTNNGDLAGVRNISRSEFMFISDMMVMEKIVIPTLLAHGMNFPTTLLPQLLKLLAAMLLPIIPQSYEVPRQLDCVRRLIERCGTDEFFSLLTQCVAPITEKRSKGQLCRDDVILLEIVLRIITLFFTGPKESIVHVIGAFSRNHGIDLFVVVIIQNYARYVLRNRKDNSVPLNMSEENSIAEEGGDTGDMTLDIDKGEESVVELTDESEERSELTSATDSDNSDQISVHLNVDDQYTARMAEILESGDQLHRWNTHIITAMSAILRCARSTELARLIFTSKRQESSQQMVSLDESSKHFRECMNETKKWRHVARSRNGAISSNGLLVRGTLSSRTQGEGGVIGYTSTLLGCKGRDPIEKARDIDSRKKGRFIKGMSDDIGIAYGLSLPIKIQLAQQCLSFICQGFEPLSTMAWESLSKSIDSFGDTVQERREFVAGYKASGEDAEIPSDFDKSVYESVQQVLNYFEICTSLLRYTREALHLRKDMPNEDPSLFGQQWRCIASVIAPDHISGGIELLRVVLSSTDLKKRYGLGSIAKYLAELFMILNHLMDGDIVKASDVITAARAIVSAVLYNEENISLIFDTISKSSPKCFSSYESGVHILLIYSTLRLMEKCSFGGRLLLPKKRRKTENLVDDGANETPRRSCFNSGMDNECGPPNLPHEPINITTDENKDPNEFAENLISQSYPEVTSIDQIQEEIDRLKEVAANRDSSVARESWVHSTHSTEREVNMRSYFRRLCTAQNSQLLLSSLRHWRVNDSDVNEGLVFLIRSFIAEECVNALFSAPFLIIMRDILTNGEDTHRALYEVCDEVVYLFFNPAFAKILDERKEAKYGSSAAVLLGSQSFLGFEVSLRCARSLFCFSSTEYAILEERGQPHLADFPAIPSTDKFEIIKQTDETLNGEDSPSRLDDFRLKQDPSYEVNEEVQGITVGDLSVSIEHLAE
uniref:Uncharacterized protein n=1 Tax=Trypanosoma congolense (strain IL3000) TaxID=1068625 RepID=G0US81_TRYCI|nr:conserved hypothetical protein [Trypanosoma congolense IL3000]